MTVLAVLEIRPGCGATIVVDDGELAGAIETLANRHRAKAPDSHR